MKPGMRVMITGASGMLGRSLARHLQAHELTLVGTKDFDLTDALATNEFVFQAKPDVVIHCAAFTAVDRCESEVERAFAVNATGSANLARACFRSGARLIAISTDYVFSGDLDRPYVETDPTGPRTVYGQSKLAGEEAIQRLCPDHTILRVAWLYGQGGPSFVHTLSRLGRQSGDALKVVDDQIGNPTSCDSVAAHTSLLLDVPTAGILHLTCEGSTSWYGFTQAIFAELGLSRGLEPCGTSEFPRPAPRPANSQLDNRGLRALGLPAMSAWQDSLRQFFEDFPQDAC